METHLKEYLRDRQQRRNRQDQHHPQAVSRFRLIGKRSIAVLHILREPLNAVRRRYTALDGRSPEKFEEDRRKARVRCRLDRRDRRRGNRPEMDRKFYEMSGLVLLPFLQILTKTFRTVAQTDSKRSPMPGHSVRSGRPKPWQQMPERTLDELMQDYRPRLLDPIYSVSSASCCWNPGSARVASALTNVCRRLAWQVLELMERRGQEAEQS